MAGRCRLATPLGRGAVGKFPYRVAAALHDGKWGFSGSVGFPVAVANVSAFDGRDSASISVKGSDDHRNKSI